MVVFSVHNVGLRFWGSVHQVLLWTKPWVPFSFGSISYFNSCWFELARGPRAIMLWAAYDSLCSKKIVGGEKKSLGPFKQTNTQYMTLGTHGQEATCIFIVVWRRQGNKNNWNQMLFVVFCFIWYLLKLSNYLLFVWKP
jgi:hypothetical protein